MKVLIANRGEIAVRIARAGRSLGWQVQHVHAHREPPLCEDSITLPGTGVDAYLDVDAVVAAAAASGSTLVHPGYGFLSESPELARACAEAGLGFVGPSPQILELFGDKARARDHATRHGIPVLGSTGAPAGVDEITALFDSSPAGVMIKAVSGGGGRGMRAVTDRAEIAGAVERCRSEAERAFGQGDVYAERLLPRAKHLEVQILGDGTGQVVALGERECSIQRRHQKVIEYAPSPVLSERDRARLFADAIALAEPVGYAGLGTVEFLVDADRLAEGELDHVFIEVNPRLQVEHTVTEEVTGVDLVVAGLRIAAGEDLTALGLQTQPVARPDRYAVQCRLNAERVQGPTVAATTGTVSSYAAPEDTRVDTYLRVGTTVDGTFDSLLAKVITVTEGDFDQACDDAVSALDRLTIEGVDTNIDLLRRILSEADVRSGVVTTGFLDAWLAAAAPATTDADPSHVTAPMNATVVSVDVKAGDTVGPRTALLTLEAMKMEHPVTAGTAGVIEAVHVDVGDQVAFAHVLIDIIPSTDDDHPDDDQDAALDLDHIRDDLAELHGRVARTRDGARPQAVAKRHARGHLTARESIEALIDAGSFCEYGTFPVAAQRSRRGLDDLIDNTPADGIVTGLATINAEHAEDGGACAVLAYDYTVLAGTQGYYNHKKTDRMLHVAKQRGIPVVLFAEGGGGRPGDTDTHDVMAAGLNVTTFAMMGSLSGTVPTVGVLTGRCFAGNAALLGCCDVIIATRDANLGMAGPAMIEGGGLGRFAPEDIGPMDVQAPNGVVDIVVEDDAAAVDMARRYLSYFQGAQAQWTQADQRRLRHVIGENRKQVYAVRDVIDLVADEGSVLELRREFGVGAVTSLVRVEGRPMGLVANDPTHLGGAIDADAADKMARFLQLCDAHGLPVISLCDTPGFMVGPESETTATVRHFSRLFVIAAHLRVPMITVVLRKGYGLGAQAMASGGFSQTLATVAWPTGEIGGMGLEGAVQLGYAKELAAITDPDRREARYQQLLDAHYETGKAINGAMKHEFDEVIDPVDTRRWIMATLGSHTPERRGDRYIDTW